MFIDSNAISLTQITDRVLVSGIQITDRVLVSGMQIWVAHMMGYDNTERNIRNMSV
jgi:hypothetical protein